MRVRTDLPLLMENRDINQMDLSEITGIPRVYIVYIVNGRMLPNNDQLEKICQALKVTSDMIYPDPELRKCLAGDPPKRKSRAASTLHEARREMRKAAGGPGRDRHE